MGKKRDQVKRKYPLAVCVPWWIRDNAYQIHESSAVFVAHELGRGASPSLAWADAAKRLRGVAKLKQGES